MYCGRVATRGGMARHLRSCPKRQQVIGRGSAAAEDGEPILHLQVQDTYSGQYWLHLEMRGSAPLKSLDRYLRAIWLECCGHMSKFTVGDSWGGRDVSESTKVANALRPGAQLTHVYDFGTSSYTTIKAVNSRTGILPGRHPISLLARNDPPVMECMKCGESAVVLCMECVHEHELAGGLCEQHAAAHPHVNYGEPLPIVNSPRLGMCGYDGPAEAPY